MKHGWVIIAGLLLAFAACSTQKRVGGAGSYVVPVIDDDSLQTILYYTEGVKARIVDNDIKKADYWLNKALALDSLHAPSWYEKAMIYMESNPDTALFFSSRAAAVDTVNLDNKGLLARLMVMTGNYVQARRTYEKLVVDDPHNALNYRMLAALYEYDRQPFTAIALLDTAEYRLGRIGELSDYKRSLLVGVKLYDRAIEETKALIAEEPYLSQNYRYLGELYAMTKRDSLAESNFKQSLRLDSTNVETLYAMADYYKRSNRVPQYFSIVDRIFSNKFIDIQAKKNLFDELTASIEFYRDNYFAINSLVTTLITTYPRDFDVLQLYATHLIRSGEIEQALQLYKNFDRTQQPNLQNYFAIIEIESYLKNADSVEMYTQKALGHFPRNTDLYLRKGYSLLTAEKYTEALESYREALKYAPTDSVASSVLGTIGDLYFQWKKPQKCFATYNKALRKDPNNIVVLNNYAYFLSETPSSSPAMYNNQMNEALQMSDRSCTLSPKNATYMDTKAWILYRLKRYDEAKQAIMEAVAFDTTDSETLLFHYAEILSAMGENFMARIYYRRALEKGYDAETIARRLEQTNP